MTPLVLATDQAAPGDALAVDGFIPGAAAVYSHWKDHGRTPPELRDDTSTAMLVRAAREPARWLDPYAVVCNNHLDADGLLALMVACRPDVARRHGRLLVDAAESGDFTAWRGEAAFRLMLTLHQALRTGTDQAVAERLCAEPEDLLHQHRLPDAERDAAVAQVLAAMERLRRQDEVAVTVGPLLATIAWTRRLGHASDVFGQVFAPDDLPLIALSTIIPDDRFQLTSERHDGGWRHVLEAPRHSWAATVIRPLIPWPDLADLTHRLAEEEPQAGWQHRPACAFTGLLAAENSPTPPDLMAARLLPHLTA